jgi:hypothetical protein
VTRFLPVIIFLVISLAVIVPITIGFISSINQWPYNPFKWAQERRWRENSSRRVRILALEHEVGLHANRDDDCYVCRKMTTLDNSRRFVERIYDMEVEYGLRKSGGTASGGPR